MLAKLREEIDELEAAIEVGNAGEIEAEIGDTYFSLTNLARHLDVDPEASIRRTNQKFITRFAFIEKTLAEQGKNLDDCNLGELEALWQQAKKIGSPAE